MSLRLLHVEAGMHLYGGAQQVLYLIRELRELGQQSALVCPKGAAVGVQAQQEGFEVFELGPNGDLDFGFISRLRKLIRGHRPDLVHLHSRRGADLLGSIAAYREGCPAVLSRRVDNPEHRLLARFKYRYPQRIVSISEGIQRVLEDCGAPREKLRVVRSAVDPAPFQTPAARAELESEFGLTPGGFVIGVVAQLIPRKGHRVLFQALQALQNAPETPQLICFGRGPEESALRSYASQLQLQQRIHFAGFRSDLARWVGALDLVAHPAMMEGLGVSLLQASAAGVPIVASRVGGIPEAVRDGVSGLLVDADDRQQLAAAIRQLMENPELRRQFGRQGRELIAAEFSTAVMARGNLAVYRELLASG